MTRAFLLPSLTIAQRELLRFLRQPSRVIGIVGSPILFWFVIGSGLGESFRFPSAPPRMDYLEYFYPGTLVLIILFTAIFSTISIIEDRREGFLQAVLAAPIPRSAIVMGKLIGVTGLSLLQAVLFLMLLPISNISVSFLAVVSTLAMVVLVGFGIAGLGFAIAWRMESTQGFHAIMNLLLIPMWMLSGALFPSSGAATWVWWIMQANPLTYNVAATRMTLYGFADEYMKDLPSIEFCLLISFLFAVGTFVVSVLAVRKRPQGLPILDQR